MKHKVMSYVALTAILAFPVSYSPIAAHAADMTSTPAKSSQTSLTSDEEREYQAFSNLYTREQFKTFVEQTLVSLPDGRTITVIRYLVAEREGRSPAGATIEVATNAAPGKAIAKTISIAAVDFFESLRKANNSLADTLTAPLAAHNVSLTDQAQEAVQRRIGSAISKALTTTPSPAPSTAAQLPSPEAVPTAQAPATATPSPSPTPSPIPTRTCEQPSAAPQSSTLAQESVKDIQAELKVLSQPTGDWDAFSTQYPPLAYKICLAESGRGSHFAVFPIENTVVLYPTSPVSGGGLDLRRFNGSIYNKFDIANTPSLELAWESTATGQFFGTTRDLVKFVASIQYQNEETAAVNYQIFLGFSSIPIISGSMQASNLAVDLQDQPQQVISFSKKIESVPLGVLKLDASFDLSGTLSDEYIAASTSRSLYFSMSPKIVATATGKVGVSAFVSSASLNGTLTIIDYTGEIGGAAILFKDPFSVSHATFFADRYISRAAGTALKGSLSLDVTLICPAALKKLLCLRKSFPLYATTGYPLVTQILPEGEWEVFSPGTTLSSRP